MVDGLLHQIRYSSVHALLGTSLHKIAPIKIGRQQRAQSSMTLPRMFAFAQILHSVRARDLRSTTKIQAQ